MTLLHHLITLFVVIKSCEVINCERTLGLRVNNHYEHFIDHDFSTFPKCCPMKSALIATDDRINCTSTGLNYETFDISAPSIATNGENFYENCENIDCVDYLKNETKWRLVRMFKCDTKTIYKQFSMFPKCCPLGLSYDPLEYRCMPRENSAYAYNDSLQVINVSLAHCASIDTAIINVFDKFKVNRDKSITLEGDGRSFNFGNYCIDENARSGKQMVRVCVEYQEACKNVGRRCLKKCCPDGQVYKRMGGPPVCMPDFEAALNVSNNERFNQSDKEYAILYGGQGQKYLASKKHNFYINPSGDFHILEAGLNWVKYSPKNAYYCFETFSDKLLTFLFIQDHAAFNFITYFNYIHGFILAMSCLFLIIMIACYLVLPEMKNVHGKSILMFCIFMLVGFLTLSFAKIHGPGVSVFICATIGFTIMFSFLGAFAWMNVICFDMWIAFGTMRIINVQNKKKDLKKFLLYNLYGWGVPVLFCGVAVIVYNTKCLPDAFVPHIGTIKCYLEKPDDSYDAIVYFIFPECTMILINLLFFIKTSIYCYKVKNEIQKMRGAVGDDKEARQRRFNDDKEKLIMLVKLFLVMGIPWTFEAVSTIIPFNRTIFLKYVEAIVDCFNGAQGIIIFCIFILKKKVWTSIQTRFGITPVRRVSELSTGITTDLTAASGNGASDINAVTHKSHPIM